MRRLDFTPNFRAELSNIEIEGIERIVDTFSRSEGLIPDSREMEFAYTSSSSHAMHNVTSLVTFEDDDEGEQYQIEYFSITNNDMLIMAVTDEDENYYYYEIETEDFYG